MFNAAILGFSRLTLDFAGHFCPGIVKADPLVYASSPLGDVSWRHVFVSRA